MNDNIRNRHLVRSGMFSYNAGTNCFMADMSVLQHSGADPLGQLFHDACDSGFVMVSERTQKEAVWYLSGTITNSEGEISAWTFLPMASTVIAHQLLEGAKLIVWNT